MLRDLGISEAKLQNALLEVWNKQDLMQSQSLQSPVADQQHTHGISLDGSAQTGSTPPATPADSPEPSTNEARPDSMQLQSEAYQDSAASAQGAAQQNAVTGEHGVAARQQPGCHASEGQPLTQSVHQHQVGTSNASSQQPNSFSISSDRHGITSPNTEPNGAQSAACQHQHQDQLASDQHHTGQMGDSSVLDAGSNPSQHTGGQHSIPGSAVNGAVQAAGQPTVLFTSATTGRGLPELLHEVERKVDTFCCLLY